MAQRVRVPSPVFALAVVAVVMVMTFMIGACRRRDADSIGSPQNPVHFVLSPDHRGQASAADLQAFGEYLGRETGYVVQVSVAASPGEAVASLGEGHADVALLNLFEFLLAHQEYGADAALQLVRGGATSYTGDIVVRADGPVRRLEDLAGRRVALVDRYSTSGFVLAAQLFARAGVSPKVEFAGSHEAALARLRAGTADAAATFHNAAAADPTLRAVANTGAIPNEPVCFRKWLPEPQRKKIAAALVRYAGMPEGKAVLGRISRIDGFRPVTDGDYRESFETVRAAGQAVESLVPGGWSIWAANRPVFID